MVSLVGVLTNTSPAQPYTGHSVIGRLVTFHLALLQQGLRGRGRFSKPMHVLFTQYVKQQVEDS